MLCFNEFVFSQIDTNAIHVDTAIIDTSIVSLKEKSDSSKKILYGQASFYSDKLRSCML